MRIAHVGVAGPFTENMSYQDNILSHQNALDVTRSCIFQMNIFLKTANW